MSGSSACLAVKSPEQVSLERLMRLRERGLNRQLGFTLVAASFAYALCWLCAMTDVFLTGHALGTVAFLPGAILMAVTGVWACCRPADENDDRPYRKYAMLGILALAIMGVALIQLVWAVPCLVGLAAYVYAYHNPRLVIVFNSLWPVLVIAAAALNAAYGMPNPDMLPYPPAIEGIREGYVTLWAMNHPEAWDKFAYFLRILRFHTLPLFFLMAIASGMGWAMVRRHNRMILRLLERESRIREIEDALTAAAVGALPSVPAPRPMLSPAFLASIPPREIPRLLRTLRTRSGEDPRFAELLLTDPERAIREVHA